MKTVKRISCFALVLALICGLSAHAGIIVYKHLADPVLFHGHIEQSESESEPQLVCLIDGVDTRFTSNDLTGGKHTIFPILKGEVTRDEGSSWHDENGKMAISVPKITLKTEDGSPYHGDTFFKIQVHAHDGAPLSEDVANALKFKYVQAMYDASGWFGGVDTDAEIGVHMIDGYAESYAYHMCHDVLRQDGRIELDFAAYAKSEAVGDFDIAFVFFTGDFADEPEPEPKKIPNPEYGNGMPDGGTVTHIFGDGNGQTNVPPRPEDLFWLDNN